MNEKKKNKKNMIGARETGGEWGGGGGGGVLSAISMFQHISDRWKSIVKCSKP